jgi:hypothetical protein
MSAIRFQLNCASGLQHTARFGVQEFTRLALFNYRTFLCLDVSRREILNLLLPLLLRSTEYVLTMWGASFYNGKKEQD